MQVLTPNNTHRNRNNQTFWNHTWSLKELFFWLLKMSFSFLSIWLREWGDHTRWAANRKREEGVASVPLCPIGHQTLWGCVSQTSLLWATANVLVKHVMRPVLHRATVLPSNQDASLRNLCPQHESQESPRRDHVFKLRPNWFPVNSHSTKAFCEPQWAVVVTIIFQVHTLCPL